MEVDEQNHGKHSTEQKDENTVIPSTAVVVDQSDSTNFANTMKDSSISKEQSKLAGNSHIKRCKRLLSAKGIAVVVNVFWNIDHWYTDPDQLEYLNDCRLRGALPSGYFIRHLKDESISLKYSVLGLKKLKPIFSSISNSLNITQLDLTNTCLNDEVIILHTHV